MILPTELLKKMVDEVIELEQYNTVNVTFMLRNHQDQQFSIDDAFINLLIFEQNFMANTTDKIQISVNLNPQQLQQIVAKQSDLYADLIFEYVNTKTGEILLDEDPIHRTYKVLIHDLSSITKKFGVRAFEDTDGGGTVSSTQGAVSIQVDMQLIGEKEYIINKAQFCGMIRNINIEEAVKYVASVMGIKKIIMVPPDNKQNYQHLIIPPEKGGFREIFDFLQHKYGIYVNGCRHYITEGTLYVYPPFDMKSERKPRLNILRVSENSYIGALNYHKEEDNGDLTIISNSPLTSKTLTNIGNENEGNTKLFVRSDAILDGQVKKGKDFTLNNITASMSGKTDNSISKGAAVPKYVKSTMNLYGHASTFSEFNTELIACGWPCSRLDIILPGVPTSFVFDEKNSVLTKTGILEAVKYTFTRQSKTIFTCATALMIRSDPSAILYNA